jgi:SAM-dependent methyltransferase
MPRNRDECPLDVTSEDRVRSLRGVLNAAGYNRGTILEVLGAGEDPTVQLRRQDIPRLLRKVGDRSPRDVLFRLFLLGVPVDAEAAHRAVGPTSLEDWYETGLLEPDGSSVRALVRLVPSEQLILALEKVPRYEETRPDRVMGVASSSLMLARLTMRRPVRRTLDLGTGCGVQALLAAPHSEAVVAVDRNPRAVNVATFNAQLNGLANLEVREGNFFEPVRDQTFDLVVSNPPFIISPRVVTIFRESGLGGDRVCELLLRELPRYLNPGGFAQFLCNWAHLAGQDEQDRLAGWFQDNGCDVWVLHSHTCDAATYATTWLPEADKEREDFADLFDAWLAYYEREKIEAVSYGLITLRRRPAATNWIRWDDSPELLGPCGESIVRGFEQRDLLESLADDQALMAAHLRLAPEVRLEQQLEPSADGWSITAAHLRIIQGLGYKGDVDRNMMALVSRFRGAKSVGEVVTDLAGALKQDVSAVANGCLGVVRRLIEQGFLIRTAEDLSPPPEGIR